MNQFRLPPSLLLAIPVLVTLGLLSACRSAHHAPLTEQSASGVLMVCNDNSASERKDLPAAVHLDQSVAALLDPKKDWVTCFGLDAALREFRSDAAPLDSEAFADELVDGIGPLNATEGTRLDLFWIEAARRSAKCNGQVAILLTTDGFADGVDANGHARILQAAKSLAGNPHVKVVAIVGAKAKQWSELRHDLAPVESKLRLFPFSSFDAQAIADAIHGVDR